MRKKLSTLLSATIAFALALVIIACSSNGGDYDVKATGVTFGGVDELTIKMGSFGLLEATVLPENATNKTVVWESSPRGVVAVDDIGRIRPITTGWTIVSAYSADGGSRASCLVSVVLPMTQIVLSTSRLDLDLAGTAAAALTATALPAEASDKMMIWASDNPAIATVSGQGQGPSSSPSTTVVEARAVGIANITATSLDGAIVASCYVNVANSQIVSATSVTISPSPLQVLVEGTALLTATVLPSNATYKFVEWLSVNPAIATVNPASGVVTGVSVGEATIWATNYEGVSGSVTVQVATEFIPNSVSLNKKSLAMVSGYTEALSATVLPAHATNKNLIWDVANANVATVSDAGLVTAVAPGVTTVFVYTEKGNNMDECVVTVHNMYIAGHESGGSGTAARLWANGAAKSISAAGSNADACSVFVRGRDIYVAGHQANASGASVATVWTMSGDSEPYTASIAANGSANSIFISSLGEQYVAGYEENSNRVAQALLWRNGPIVFARLTNGGGKAEAKSVFVSNNIVYAAGYDTNAEGFTVPFLYATNGSTAFLTDGSRSAGAGSVYVWGSSTYVAGWENDEGGKPVAMLWVNGSPKVLGAGNGMANAVHVSASGDVYVAGYEINSRGVNVATVWKGDSAMSLGSISTMNLTNGGSEAVANSVYILETDVYVVGYEVSAVGKPEPKVWRNGFGRTVALEGKANSIVIAPPVLY